MNVPPGDLSGDLNGDRTNRVLPVSFFVSRAGGFFISPLSIVELPSFSSEDLFVLKAPDSRIFK
jgi:hypothetical protein